MAFAIARLIAFVFLVWIAVATVLQVRGLDERVNNLEAAALPARGMPPLAFKPIKPAALTTEKSAFWCGFDAFWGRRC